MPNALLIGLAWRNLLRRARRTGMLVLAVAVGVASLVLVAALLRGWLAATVDETLASLTGQVRIHAPGWLEDPGAAHAFRVPAELAQALAGREDVRAWTTRIRLPGVVMSARETRGLMVVGVDPDAERTQSFLGKAEIEGKLPSGPGGRGLVLGRALAESLETGVGKRVVLMMQNAAGETVERGYRVVGRFDAAGTALEKGFAFTGRKDLAATLGIDGVTELAIRRDAVGGERALIQALRPRLGGLRAYTWRELAPQAAALLGLANGMIWVWYLIMMAALGFGLINTLLASVLERMRELGLLQALGMRPSGVLWQVVLESWMIVAVGLGAGFAGGVLGVWALSDGIDLSAWAAGVEMLGISRVLVPELRADDALRIVAVVLVLGLLGSIYPGWKAVRIDPLAALNRR